MRLISYSLPPTLHYRFCEQKSDCAFVKNVYNVTDNSSVSQRGKFLGQMLHITTFSLACIIYINLMIYIYSSFINLHVVSM